MSSDQLQPVHRTILALDIEGFGGPQRSDPVRSTMRLALYGLLHDALTSALGDLSRCSLSDLGDGVLILVEPEVSKLALLHPLMPEIARGLKRYNATASANARIRLRAVLHSGEIVPDSQGYSGEDLNFSFRLLDAAELRAALAASPANLALIVSQSVYNGVVTRGWQGIDPAAYRPVEVHVKETKAKAWIHIPAETDGEESTAGMSARLDKRPRYPSRSRMVQREIEIRALPPGCLYVSIGDVHNYRLYQLQCPEVPLRNHLQTALLLGRRAVLHCADPFRSEEVVQLLTEYQDAIVDGSLLFLMNENVVDPRRHFAAYIQTKRTQYGKSRYGKTDVESLQVPDPEAAVERAITFLEMSPFLLRRGFGASDAFINAIKADMRRAEQIVLCEHYHASAISRLNLSLRQILQLAQVRPDGLGHQRLLADDATIGGLQTKIASLASYDSFSKQILIALIQEQLGIDEDNPYYELIWVRVTIVHLLATIGRLGFLEVTHARDRESPYYYDHLIAHLAALADSPPRGELSRELVNALRQLPSWRAFANYHLRLMADLKARQASGDEAVDPWAMFEASRVMPEFDEVRAVVRQGWEA
jgi:hypothetical protein